MPVQKQRWCVRADGRAPAIDEQFVRTARLAICARPLAWLQQRELGKPIRLTQSSPLREGQVRTSTDA